MADTELVIKKTTLREIDFTALDYETIQRELIDYIKIASSNKGLVDDFSSGDASKIMIDLFSYLGDLLAFRIDTLSSESYLPTAQRRQSIINLLELVAQRPKNPTYSTLSLIAVPAAVTPTPITISPRHSFTTTGLDGNSVEFEIMSGPTEYFASVQIPAGVSNSNVTAFSGSYKSLNVISPGQASFQVTLPSFPVIEDSVKVSVTPVSSISLTPAIIESTRVKEVLSLVDPTDEIFYSIKYDEDGRALLTFPTEDFGKIPPNGHTIHIDYRIGGGKNTNVTQGSVNFQASFSDSVGNFVSVAFANPSTFASGGNDLEDLDTIKLRAPALVRANNNLVTVDDYEAIIAEISGVQDVFAVDAYSDDSVFGGKFGVPDNSVFIWVLPSLGGEISPDLRQRIAFDIDSRRLVAIQNFIFNPVYNNWTVNANVKIISTANSNSVRQSIIDALLNEFGRNVATFKNKVRRSKVTSIIQGVNGVDYLTLNSPSEDIDADENEVLRLLESNISLTLS